MSYEFDKDLLSRINDYAKATGADPNKPINIQVDESTAQSNWFDKVFTPVHDGMWTKASSSQQKEPTRELKEGEDYEVIE